MLSYEYIWYCQLISNMQPLIARETSQDGLVGIVPVLKPRGSSLIEAVNASMEDKQFLERQKNKKQKKP